MDTNYIGGYNITVEKERDELREMINDLLEVEKKHNKLLDIWEKFETLYGQYTIPVEGNLTSIKKLMIDAEIDNQYFPEGEKKNGKNSK